MLIFIIFILLSEYFSYVPVPSNFEHEEIKVEQGKEILFILPNNKGLTINLYSKTTGIPIDLIFDRAKLDLESLIINEYASYNEKPSKISWITEKKGNGRTTVSISNSTTPLLTSPVKVGLKLQKDHGSYNLNLSTYTSLLKTNASVLADGGTSAVKSLRIGSEIISENIIRPEFNILSPAASNITIQKIVHEKEVLPVAIEITNNENNHDIESNNFIVSAFKIIDVNTKNIQKYACGANINSILWLYTEDYIDENQCEFGKISVNTKGIDPESLQFYITGNGYFYNKKIPETWKPQFFQNPILKLLVSAILTFFIDQLIKAYSPEKQEPNKRVKKNNIRK